MSDKRNIGGITINFYRCRYRISIPNFIVCDSVGTFNIQLIHHSFKRCSCTHANKNTIGRFQYFHHLHKNFPARIKICCGWLFRFLAVKTAVIHHALYKIVESNTLPQFFFVDRTISIKRFQKIIQSRMFVMILNLRLQDCISRKINSTDPI